MKKILEDKLFRSGIIGSIFCLSIYFSISDDWESLQNSTAAVV
jgi:hypothetical protein